MQLIHRSKTHWNQFEGLCHNPNCCWAYYCFLLFLCGSLKTQILICLVRISDLISGERGITLQKKLSIRTKNNVNCEVTDTTINNSPPFNIVTTYIYIKSRYWTRLQNLEAVINIIHSQDLHFEVSKELFQLTSLKNLVELLQRCYLEKVRIIHQFHDEQQD